ncbi:hsp70 nucleotide exchange factor fes1, partial [Dimargaris verticillata]
MEKLLQWAIINSATEKEDAPPRDSTQTVAPKQLDPAIIDHILGKDDSVLMKEAMAAALDPCADPETKEVALTDLELLVSQIDNANNLVPLRLWDPLLGLLDSPEPALRRDAVWVCGTSVQNNPKAQQAFLDRKGLDKALALVASDPDEAVRDKAMYCVSAAVRQFPPGLKYFFEQRGLPVIKTALTTSENPRLLRRIYFLLATLVQVEDYQPVI